MLGKETRILVVATVLLLTVVLATAVMAQGTDDPVTVDLSDIKEDAVRQLFDDSGKMIDPNQRLAIVAQEHEGGFGGFYHEGIAYVYMQASYFQKRLTRPLPTSTCYPNVEPRRSAAVKAFNAAYNGSRNITKIIPVQGDYSLDDLVEWLPIVAGALVANDIHPRSFWLSVQENRVRIGLASISQADDARQLVRDLEIPEGSVVFEEQPIGTLLVDGGSGRARMAPYMVLAIVLTIVVVLSILGVAVFAGKIPWHYLRPGEYQVTISQGKSLFGVNNCRPVASPDDRTERPRLGKSTCSGVN